MTRQTSAAEGRAFPLSDGEFVGLMAAIMALNALGIDTMLPALPIIGRDLHVAHANQLQFIVSVYILANGVGSLVVGPLGDRFGRRIIILSGIALAGLCGLASAVAPSFEALLVIRGLHGLACSALGVLTISVVRDRFHGDRMARMMSLVAIVFMAVPVLAPSAGELIMAVAGWREIFHFLAAGAAAVGLWVYLRLPETLPPERRQPLHLPVLARNWGFILTQRLGVGYMFGTGAIMGGMFGFLMSGPQIFDTAFHAPGIFPIAFACIAGAMALANFSNSRIVERFGARRVSHTALFCVILFSLLQLGASSLFPHSMPLFIVLVALTMGMVGFTGSNFSAISMEPYGHIAGSASSFQSFTRLIMGAVIGGLTGQRFDGTTAPLAQGFLATSLLALACILWAEHGRLFTRPHRAKLREPPLPG